MATSIIFPAFVNEYNGTEGKVISAYENNFFDYLELASAALQTDLTGFDFLKCNFLDNELTSQYISYLFSCSVADILKSQKIKSSFVSGYSMGIYAALYYCGSISLTDGLQLVQNAWNVISQVTAKGTYGMGMIVGLDETDLIKILKSYQGVEICNQNNPHTFVISGVLDEVGKALLSAKDEGALHIGKLPVSKPYHSGFVKDALPEFSKIVRNMKVRNPDYKYISTLDQKIIDTPEAIRYELIQNLASRMNWLKTMRKVIDLDTDIIFECGASDGLTRNSRFIEGNFNAFSVIKLDKFLQAALR